MWPLVPKGLVQPGGEGAWPMDELLTLMQITEIDTDAKMPKEIPSNLWFLLRLYD